MSPKKAVKKIIAWSHSRYKKYVQCPLSAKLEYLDRIKDPSPKHPAMQRGIDIHDLAENYVLGRLKRLPKELKLFAEEFKALKKLKVPIEVEQQWAFTKGWKVTGWFDSDCWLRVMLDCNYVIEYAEGHVLKCIDYKTGKIRPELQEQYMEQLELYAIAGFLKYADVDIVEGELWYLDEGVLMGEGYEGDPNFGVFHRKDLAKLKKKWEKKTKAMLGDTIFAPRPGNYCRWCWYKKDKGGHCEF
jgi:hypothetical protein